MGVGDKDVLDSGLALQVLIEKVPRERLAVLPTPLQDCPRLTKVLGGPRILVKRDDLTGLAFGGNKARQLEFVLAHAIASGADSVVVGAGLQSNLCCQVAAAANRLGLAATLVLAGHEPESYQGNLLLDHLLGAEIQFAGPLEFEQVYARCDEIGVELARKGRKPYVIKPWELSGSIAAIGYVNAALELAAQFRIYSVSPTYLFTAATDATPAGLILGFKILGRGPHVVAVSPALSCGELKSLVARLAAGTSQLLGVDTAIGPAEVDGRDAYIGADYSAVTEGACEAVRLFAETEGLFVEPIYTGRALAALIDHVRSAKIGRDESVVFLHTGGLPALFAYNEQLASRPV